MKIPVRYNQANGVVMPSPAPRPRQTLFVPQQAPMRGTPRLQQIPLMPARPIQPNIQMAAPPMHVQGPNMAHIPRRLPQPLRPNLRPLPDDLRRRGQTGQFVIRDEGPDTLPRPNLPKFVKFNASAINQANKNMQFGMRRRGGMLPSAYQVHIGPWLQRHKRRPVMMRDLGLNSVGGSNSPMLQFGSHSGRTLESPYFAGH